MEHLNLDHKNGPIINKNYFDKLLPRFEDNCCFYANLKNYLINDRSTIEQQVDNLYYIMSNKMNLKSDFEELFLQVYDSDISCDGMRCTKVLILLYNKLGLLDKMCDDTISEFICTLNTADLDTNGIDDDPETIKSNQKDMIRFVIKNGFFHENYTISMEMLRGIKY